MDLELGMIKITFNMYRLKIIWSRFVEFFWILFTISKKHFRLDSKWSRFERLDDKNSTQRTGKFLIKIPTYIFISSVTLSDVYLCIFSLWTTVYVKGLLKPFIIIIYRMPEYVFEGYLNRCLIWHWIVR